MKKKVREDSAWNPNPKGEERRKIRLIECNAKCRYLKKTLRQVFYLYEAPSPPTTPYSLQPYTLYTCIQYTYSHSEGGRGEPERR